MPYEYLYIDQNKPLPNSFTNDNINWNNSNGVFFATPQNEDWNKLLNWCNSNTNAQAPNPLPTDSSQTEPEPEPNPEPEPVAEPEPESATASSILLGYDQNNNTTGYLLNMPSSGLKGLSLYHIVNMDANNQTYGFDLVDDPRLYQLLVDNSLNCIRYPITVWERDYGYLASYADSDEIRQGLMHDKIVAGIKMALDNDIYVILDWHTHGFRYEGVPEIGVDEQQSFFTTILTMINDDPNSSYIEKLDTYLIWEIFNEPTGNVDADPGGPNTWSADGYPDTLIENVRALEAQFGLQQHLIIIGTSFYSQCKIYGGLPIPSTSNLYNTCFCLHFYSGSHSLDHIKSAMGVDELGYVKDQNGTKYPIFVSEWGMANAQATVVTDADTIAAADIFRELIYGLGTIHIPSCAWCLGGIGSSAQPTAIFDINNNQDFELTDYGTKVINIITTTTAPFPDYTE